MDSHNFLALIFSVSEKVLFLQAEDRLTPEWHVGQPCGKAPWESLEGKPQIP